jgi:hypothetical protein
MESTRAASRSVVWLLACLLLAACNLVGASPTVAPTLSPTASPVPTAPPLTPSPVAATPTPIIGTGPCDPIHLAAKILSWEGATGHRIASVEMKNGGAITCTIHVLDQPQLVAGDGTVLIAGAPPASAGILTMAPGAVLKTQVQDDNYCGSAPVPPVTLAFVFPSGEGRVVATPLSPIDTSGVPPCFGNPGSPGTIEMQPWAP